VTDISRALRLWDEGEPDIAGQVSRKPVILPFSALLNFSIIMMVSFTLQGRHNGAAMRPVTARSFASGRARGGKKRDVE
jgi:hypothetical protein